MNKIDTKIFKDISSLLSKSTPHWFGTKARFDVSQSPLVRSFANSFIAKYAIEGINETQAVLVKIAHRPHQTDIQAAIKDDTLRQLAKNEMTQLKATWQSFHQLGNPDLIAVQPLDYLEEWNAIVMIELKARPLRYQLVSPLIGFSEPNASAEFIQHLRKACQWLRHYHDHVGGSQPETISQARLQDRLQKIRSDVSNNIGTRLDAPTKLSAIESKIKTISGMESFAQLHGDFHCSNILVTSHGQISVIDPRANPNRRSIYNDLATLLTDLYLKPIPMFTGGSFTQTFLEQSRQAIVESYFKPGEYSPSLLNFYCACEVMFKWSMNERDFSKSRKMWLLGAVTGPLLNRYMSRLVDQFLI